VLADAMPDEPGPTYLSNGGDEEKGDGADHIHADRVRAGARAQPSVQNRWEGEGEGVVRGEG
jgi:hypothetical protein